MNHSIRQVFKIVKSGRTIVRVAICTRRLTLDTPLRRKRVGFVQIQGLRKTDADYRKEALFEFLFYQLRELERTFSHLAQFQNPLYTD